MKISKEQYEVIKKYFDFVEATVLNGVMPRTYDLKHEALNKCGDIYRLLWDKSYTLQSCNSCVFNMLRWCYAQAKEYEKLITMHETTLKGKIIKNRKN